MSRHAPERVVEVDEGGARVVGTGVGADHPLAQGEVGKVGVSISSLEDMEILFKGIPLDRVSTSMTINAPASVLLALYIAVAKKQGVEVSGLRGTIQPGHDGLLASIAREASRQLGR